MIKESIGKKLNETCDICVTPYLDDALEAIEMCDGMIDFYEWYDAFRNDLDIEEGERIFNMAMEKYRVHEAIMEKAIQLIEANHKSPRRYTLYNDEAFSDELYKQATEEAKRNYNDYLDENWENIQRHIKYGSMDHVPTFEEWMHQYGPGDNYIRGIMKRYKETLIDVDKNGDEFHSGEINFEQTLRI